IQRAGQAGQESLTFPPYMDRRKNKIDSAYALPCAKTSVLHHEAVLLIPAGRRYDEKDSRRLTLIGEGVHLTGWDSHDRAGLDRNALGSQLKYPLSTDQVHDFLRALVKMRWPRFPHLHQQPTHLRALH